MSFILGFLTASIFFFIFFYKKRQTQSPIIFSETNRSKKNENFSEITSILEGMWEGIIVFNSKNQILFFNSSASQIFGFSNKNVKGKNLIEVVRNSKINKLMERALSEMGRFTAEIDLLHPSAKALKIHAFGITDSNGSMNGVLVAHDLTEIRKLENVRQEFVANVSHELKTPLTSIKGFIETLVNGAIDDKARSISFLQMMNEDAGRLERLINDLLDLSKIESKEIVLKLEPIALKNEIDHILSGFQSQLERKKIQTENRVPESIEVMTDKDQLRQVFLNLIENAVKFNRSGGQIVIASEILPNKTHVKIQVSDTGMGISREDCERVFERFYRVDKMRSRELGGTGLGLSIAKHIIESHGGTISCSSEIDRGSTFSFTIPISQ